MMRPLVPGVLAATLLAVTGCGGSGTDGAEGADARGVPAGPEPVSMVLEELNGSGRSGTATISEGAAGSIDVVVVMDDEGGGLPVIHGFVRCDELAGHPDRAPDYPLEPLVEGHSETNVEFPVEEGKALFQVATGGNYFAVHERTSVDRIVACGTIPRR